MDDKFSNHVKSVFDDYEDGTADQGWTELLKKYPDRGLGAATKPHKIIPMRFWLGAIAASLLVACFILFFANEQPTDKVKLAKTKLPATPQAEISKAAEPEITTNLQPTETATSKAATTETETSTTRSTTSRSTTEASNAMAATRFSAAPAAQSPVTTANLTENLPVNGQNVDQKPTDQEIPKENTAVALNPMVLEKKPVSIEEFLAQETKNATALAANDHKSKPLTSFDVYAGTFLNYYENNLVKMNAGFGINANVKISKKVYLSVGAGISENTIAYENSLPAASLEALTSSFPLNQPNSLKSPNKPGSASGTTGAIGPAGPTGPAPNVTFAAKTSGPSTDVSINAVLLNLDVPIALKFYAGKNDRFYLLTGINSNSYINQRYMQSYTTFNYVSNTTEMMEQEVEGSRLNGFDFANSAIFAVGVSQDLSKKTTLTFEPFYRPSLKGLGDKNIRLNTIGVNLKLNVGRNK